MSNDNDAVEHPKHYRSHPSGVECITITEHMGFNLGNALKYIWRADLKNDAVEDLRKAEWYIRREIDRRTRNEGGVAKYAGRSISEIAESLAMDRVLRPRVSPVPDGVYDNDGTMHRENWHDGGVLYSISADAVDRKNSGHAPFGTYPDVPRT